MGELVKQTRLGDITFGIPGDIELLNKPWGFYEFLGLTRDASPEDIRIAYKKLALKFHPDKGGDEESFKNLERIVEILFDDGGELGKEHSQRRHYDEVSALDTYFDGFIQYKGERTKKLSEIMLIKMQSERKQAEAEHRLSEKYPEFAELEEKLGRVRSDESKKKIIEQMKDIAAKDAGLDAKSKAEFDKRREEAYERFREEQEKFAQDFRKNREDYFPKILDVFYVDDKHVTFGSSLFNMRLGFVAHELNKYILELVLAGKCYIAGFSQVHFKAKNVNVAITDPHLTGIFHVVKGGIDVDFETSSYGEVIRARAPEVSVVRGFKQRGDLFVPERFATRNWWSRKPALDIAVKEGKIQLDLRSQEFGYKISSFNSLENIISKSYKTINQDYFNNNY